MKRENRILLFVGMFFVLSLVVSETLQAQKNPKDTFTYPPLNKIQIPKIQQVVLKNGMKLFLVEDPDYPTIDLRAMIRTGSIYEPEEKIGLASITGKVLRTVGSKNISGDDLDKLLETLGATVETGIDEGSGYIYFSLFKEDIDRGLEILADLLMNPAFPEEKIDLAKIEERSIISRRNDDIGQITFREFAKLIYGAESPYARHPEYATMDAITRGDIVAFHKQYFRPNNIIFSAWGDFNSKKLIKAIEKVFASWKPVQLERPPLPKVDYTYDFTIHYVEKPDVNQSNIMLGHIGGLKNNPDYPALLVMNQILSFDRMFKRIRTDEGLAYSVWGFYGAEYDHPGFFSSGCQTKSESTVKAIRIMREELRKICENEVTDEELTRAKDSYLNGFVFNFDSKSKTVNRLMTYEYYGYPKNSMDLEKDGVEKTTKADVLRVAKKYLHPDHVRILVVGKQEDFGEPLSSLGPVNTIDITIPSPKGTAIQEATPESLVKGKALLEKAITASGGLDAAKTIRNMKAAVQLSQVTPAGEMTFSGEILLVYPDKMKATLLTPAGNMEMVVKGEEGWMKSPQGSMPLPEAVKKSYKESLLRDPVLLFQNYENLKVQYLGKRKLEEKETEDLWIAFGEYSFHLLLDSEGYLPAGYIYMGLGEQGPVEKEDIVSEYKAIGGFRIPMKTVTNAAGEKDSEVVCTECQWNVEVDPNTFEKE